jgi:hypothetical protein
VGLKGYRLWDMGQFDSNVQTPTTLSCTTRMSPAPGTLLSLVVRATM